MSTIAAVLLIAIVAALAVSHLRLKEQVRVLAQHNTSLDVRSYHNWEQTERNTSNIEELRRLL